MTTLLSLDTSTKSTGWAIFENGKYKCSGVIDDYKNIKDSTGRIKMMVRHLHQHLKKTDPDIVVIEKDVVFGNMKVIDMLMKIIGAVFGWCLLENKLYHEYAPSEWRKYVKLQVFGKKRDELKQASIKYVKDNYGLEVTDDEADAICIGEAYINHMNQVIDSIY